MQDSYNKLTDALLTKNESVRNRQLANIDPYQVSDDGDTLLIYAVYYNDIVTTTWLLEKYRSKNPQLINQISKFFKKSALEVAIEFHHTTLTALLLNAGADTTRIKNTTTFNTLGIQSDQNTIEHLMENWEPATLSLTHCLEEALRSAAEHGKLSLVAFLCEQDIDINAVNNNQNSALMLAARHGHKSTVEKLLTYETTTQNIERAFVHAGTYAAEQIKQTAYQNADNNIDPYEIMGVLFSRQPDINSVDQFGDTLLITGANSPIFLAKILSTKKIKNKINVNYENKMRGRTALFAAAQNNNISAIDILLQNGANINQKNEQGETMIMKAVEHADLESVKKIMTIPELDFDPNILLPLAIFAKKFKTAQFLLDKHRYSFQKYWACLINLSRMKVSIETSDDVELLLLRLLSGCIEDEHYDPNDIQDELPQLINNAVANQQMSFLYKLLILQNSSAKVMLNSLVKEALGSENHKLAHKLIHLMVEVGEPTFCHLRSWQDVIQINNPLEPPYLNKTLIARSYLKVLLAKPADKINDEFINAAKPYEECIVDELLKQNDTIIESSIAIIENRYANGLSKFLHTMNPEPSESKDDSFNRIKAVISKRLLIKAQENAPFYLKKMNENVDKHNNLKSLHDLLKGSDINGLYMFVKISLENQLIESCIFLLDEMVKTAEPTHPHLDSWLAISQLPTSKFSKKIIAERYFKYLLTISPEDTSNMLLTAAIPYRELILQIALETPETEVLEGYISKNNNKYAHGLSKFLHMPSTSSATWFNTNAQSTARDSIILIIQQRMSTNQSDNAKYQQLS